MSYDTLLARKVAAAPPTGIGRDAAIHPLLFPFQGDLTRWALRRGRAAIFAGTGLGKTRMQIEWARHVNAFTGRDVLILAPLAVAAQTAAEGEAIGARVTVCREPGDVTPGVNVTNYDRLHRFDPGAFGAIVLDESSIIKHHDAKTLTALMAAFRETPFRLACTATPAPNDWTELGTHAEFLGICTRSEMLAEYFCHDNGESQTWRLKGHARGAFWAWVASWGALVAHPRDLGHDGGGFDLPELRVREHLIAIDGAAARAGTLFAPEARTLMERRRARKGSTSERVEACAEAVAAEPGEPWIVWCDLNAESEALTASIPGAVEIRGSMTPDEKEARLHAFARGTTRVLVTKPSIAGFGLNWQHCARVAFVGVTDSWEAYFQAVRRCWRFGQRRAVDVHIFASEAEGAVLANLRRKEADASEMARALAAETSAAVRSEVHGAVRVVNDYDPRTPMRVPDWLREVMP